MYYGTSDHHRHRPGHPEVHSARIRWGEYLEAARGCDRLSELTLAEHQGILREGARPGRLR